ncbi:MAG: endonuclease/exonuclease/phosphatase family protein [Pirellulales bacterium]
MKFFHSAGQRPAIRQPEFEREEVAELAAKVVALPERGRENAGPAIMSNSQNLASARHSAAHGSLWRIFYLLAWVTTLLLAVVAALRIFYHDGNLILTSLNAFTRYVYLPAYPCVVWAAWQRRWSLVLAGSVIVLCHVTWMAPDFVRDRRFDLPAETAAKTTADSPSIRIFFANVLRMNREFDALLEEISAANPDVVVLAEWGWGWDKAFKNSPVMMPYVHGVSLTQPVFGMVNIFSKLPLKSELQNWVTNRLVRTADIQLGAQTLRLVALHGPRPMSAPHYDYYGYWNQMIPLLATESGPLLVVGDFNATEHSLVYRRLKSAGLRSAHDDRGRGYATTWPNETLLLPPIRIDQAFLSAQLECERIVEGRGLGSDHKPLIVDVRIRAPVDKPQTAQSHRK